VGAVNLVPGAPRGAGQGHRCHPVGAQPQPFSQPDSHERDFARPRRGLFPGRRG
jgi:hypothetical protein